VAPPSPLKDPVESPEEADASSSSSSSMSDTNHPAHRSQLYKRPPRFKQPRSRDLSTLGEGDGTHDVDHSGSHGTNSLPFASTARSHGGSRYAQDTLYQTTAKPEQMGLTDRSRVARPVRQESIDQQSQVTTETASSLASSASASDAPNSESTAKSPMSPASNHRAGLAKLGSPRQRGPRSRKDGSEGTPSMGSSFSDLDGECCT
jgi:hypothetical protein